MSAGMKIDLEIKNIDGRDWVSLLAYQELETAKKGLDEDIAQLRKNGAVTDVQAGENKRIHEANIDMKNVIDKIAIFLREQYADEIAMGQHNAFGSIADAVIFYLGKERMAAKAAARAIR